MPSNKELTDDILALDPDAQVEGLKGAELAALLKKLRAAKKATPSIGVDLSAPKEEVTTEPETDAEEPEASEEIKTTIENTDAGLTVTLEKDDKSLDETPSNLVDTQTDAEEPTKVYRVAEGKAITSKRGLIGPGEEVRPEYFANGDEVIANLVAKGILK